jgi:hypothetical protein
MEAGGGAQIEGRNTGVAPEVGSREGRRIGDMRHYDDTTIFVIGPDIHHSNACSASSHPPPRAGANPADLPPLLPLSSPSAAGAIAAVRRALCASRDSRRLAAFLALNLFLMALEIGCAAALLPPPLPP